VGNPEEVASSDRTAQGPDREVIAVRGNVNTWIEPWYGAYAILGALTSGLAIISVPLVVTNGGGTALQIGTAIAVQNLGALFAPLWGTVADRTRAYRAVLIASALGAIVGGKVADMFGYPAVSLFAALGALLALASAAVLVPTVSVNTSNAKED
jgi:hypothetical protein